MYDIDHLLFDLFLFVHHFLIQMNNVQKEMAKPIQKKIIQRKHKIYRTCFRIDGSQPPE